MLVAATSLTSWLISIVTMPPWLTRGVTFRMTPVARYSMVLMTGEEPPTTLWPCEVAIGTWSPTCKVAVWC